jgi:prepilin-type N-terminal cleavage/methylation domain-containing protein
MLWPARMRDEDGFTLPELMIGMVIMSLLIVAIAGALIVSLKTTQATEQRMHESQDVLITSSYLVNDVESALTVKDVSSGADCTAAFTKLVTFAYSSAGNPQAVYRCGTANGETQVTRTFGNGAPIVVAHFAGTLGPQVTVASDSSTTPPTPISVTITFTKPSDCVFDCTYTLFAARRSYNPSSVTTTTGSLPPGDVALLSTGAGSPLTVQGKCDDAGTAPSGACAPDPSLIASPIAPDVQTGGWPTPPALWSVLGDQDQSTGVTNTNSTEARVTLSSVNPPDTGFTPIVELHATKVSGSSPKITFTVYDGFSNPTCQSKSINGAGNYDCQVSGINANAYSHLVLGFKVSNGDIVRVDGVALDTASPQGLLTINGPLVVNSTNAGAVHLYGAKSGQTKQLTINNGSFQMLANSNALVSGGTCSGCSSSTVKCTGCTWSGQNPVKWYYPSIPDPLRSLPAPPSSPTGLTCADGGTCNPGTYNGLLSLTKPTQLKPGIYFLKQGLQASGSAAITCLAPCTGGVMLYIDVSGSVSFTGSSSVNLPALNAKVFANGLYDGVVMFQARLNQNPVKIAGTSGPNALNGIVYVPDASQVTLATGNSTFSAKAIVAQNIKVSSPVTIG